MIVWEFIKIICLILYINSLCLSVTEVLGGGGRVRPVKQRATRGDACQSVTGCGFRVTMQAPIL